LNRLVTAFFEFAELRAKQRKHTKLADWRNYVDRFMEFNEQSLLSSVGKVSRDQMKSVANQRYEEFDNNRKQAEAIEADRAELEALDNLEKKLSKREKDS